MNNIIDEKSWDKMIKDSHFDVDLVYAKTIFCNKSNQEIIDSFHCPEGGTRFIARADELRFMPDSFFNYYMPFFVRFIMECEHIPFDKADICSCFTILLEQKIDSNSLKEKILIERCNDALTYLEQHIDEYNTDSDIYGDQAEKIEQIKAKLNAYLI